MKKLLIVLTLLVSTFSFSQNCEPPRPVYFGVGMSGSYSNYNETGLNLDLSIVPSHFKKVLVYPSINADAYTAKVEDRHWTTAQIGVRANLAVNKFIFSAGPKYITQGNERYEAYNQWVFDGAVSWLYLISERDGAFMWLKLSAQYNNTPEQRVFGLIGLQFAMR